MIRKLRIKLIIASMVSLLAVLLVIMSAVNIVYYRQVVREADGTLALLADNGGFFPKSMHEAPPDDQFPRMGPRLSPELPYETRYFFVTAGEDGSVRTVNTGKIAAVDSSAAIAYAQTVLASGRTQGFTGQYRFLVDHTDEGETLLLFLDCSRGLDNFKTLLFACIGVSLIGSLLVLLLLIFLSGRIVRPFLENYEKQKQFITDAGHELKTPLTILNADAEILAMDYGENEWVSDIQAQTRRLAGLTNDLILLSRMEEEQTRLQMLALPLSDIAEETIAPFQAVAHTQGKTLALHIQPMLSLCGDEKSLRKLFSILLDNAIKYSSPQSTISCTLEQQKNQIRFSVYNAVEHIDKSQTEHLFDRFYRTDQSRNSQTGGYGLGLAIAQAIVTAHKGKISAATADQASLLITVTFPA